MFHIMELLGKARVVVKDGRVVEVGLPEVGWCPLFDKLKGIRKITPEEVRKNIEFRISDFGLFTNKHKLLELDTYVAFGASKIIMNGLLRGFFETTVTSCDGTVTVISGNSALVQGIGGRISGLIESEPIAGTALDPSSAAIKSRPRYQP